MDAIEGRFRSLAVEKDFGVFAYLVRLQGTFAGAYQDMSWRSI